MQREAIVAANERSLQVFIVSPWLYVEILLNIFVRLGSFKLFQYF
jgi:hypothetical protein